MFRRFLHSTSVLEACSPPRNIIIRKSQSHQMAPPLPQHPSRAPPRSSTPQASRVGNPQAMQDRWCGVAPYIAASRDRHPLPFAFAFCRLACYNQSRSGRTFAATNSRICTACLSREQPVVANPTRPPPLRRTKAPLRHRRVSFTSTRTSVQSTRASLSVLANTRSEELLGFPAPRPASGFCSYIHRANKNRILSAPVVI